MNYGDWLFLAWCNVGNRRVSFYEHLMFGKIARAKEVVRFDHPERRLVEKLMSRKLLGERP